MPDRDATFIGNIDDTVATVIWLHGLGADSSDFAPLPDELQLPLRYVFPNAPYRPVTVNRGVTMRAWYDVRHQDLSEQEDDIAIQESATIVNDYIKVARSERKKDVPILLAGFSQGGAIALYTALTSDEPIAGVLILSSYLPLRPAFEKEPPVKNQHASFLFLHGTHDQIIPVQHARASELFLKDQGYQTAMHEYPMEHSLCLEELAQIRQWFSLLISTSSTPKV